MQNVTNKLRIQFDNGVTIRGAYRFAGSKAITVELFVSDFNGVALHTVRETYAASSHDDGFIATVTSMEALKQYLLACNVNKFNGVPGMNVVREILISKARAGMKAKTA